ncbi:hypothetical protein AK830_g12703 [Neonectria ditissima]|uniref:Chromo domain-containing protein n=1 Tax=Neonectria ditissima TaxID=78410 RepID=A0A0P7AJP4_9HYPO|nr:hypothetical protein AK830_g12703 [Neonectria ditissima]
MLPLAQYTYNTSKHSSIGESPAECLRGFTPRGPDHAEEPLPIVSALAESRSILLRQRHEATQKLLSSVRERQATWYNRKREPMSFNVGDLVLLSTKNIKIRRPSKKLADKYVGPYRITRCIGDHRLAYELELPPRSRIHNVFHISNLEKWKGDEPEAIQQQDDPFIADDIYVIERIITHKGSKSNRRYLIKWEGYDDTESSWVSRKDFTDKNFIAEYEQRIHGEAARQ